MAFSWEGAASGAATGASFGGGWGALAGAVVGGFFGGKKKKPKSNSLNKDLLSYDIQKFLPIGLRDIHTTNITNQGVAGIGELIRNPGGLSPNVADAIRPRLAVESEAIASNFRGIRSQQEGAVARNNAPVSIKTALSSALDVAQERAQRDTRRQALSDSDALRRQDLEQTYKIFDAILQFAASGRGQNIPGLIAAQDFSQRQSAASLASISSALGSLSKINWGGTTKPVIGSLAASGGGGGGSGFGVNIGGGKTGI